MKNIITEELGYMKYLLNYKRGVVISEQNTSQQTADDIFWNKLVKYFKDNKDPNWKINEGGDNFVQTIIDKEKIGDISHIILSDKSDPNTKMVVFKITETRALCYKTKLDSDAVPEFQVYVSGNLTWDGTKFVIDFKENKENWENIVKYYSNNMDPNWKNFEAFDFCRYIEGKSTDVNDSDAEITLYSNGNVIIENKGQKNSFITTYWEWDGSKPVFKFKDITTNSPGYVQETDTEFSAITEDGKIMNIGSKGELVKEVQSTLINSGYSGDTGTPITKDIEGCKEDSNKCDGIYGKSTKEMVKQYQTDIGLTVDGIVGKQTFDALDLVG